MRSNLTDITVVLDRSGSMASCKNDAEGGLNAFIDQQKDDPNEALFTLVQFDTQYEFVHKGIPIKSVPRCALEPRGSTALLDAVGRAINETGIRLASMKEADRPGLVVFVILTDGEENASREFTKTQIKQMIEHQQSAYNWQFTFLGANQDAFAEAAGLGIAAAAAMNFKGDKAAQAFDAAAAVTKRMRSDVGRGVAPMAAYTVKEREDADS